MENIDKKEMQERLTKYVHAMKFYSASKRGQMLKVESQRFFQDHFNAYERKYIKRHCPILIRLKLWWMGAYVL